MTRLASLAAAAVIGVAAALGASGGTLMVLGTVLAVAMGAVITNTN